MRRIVALAILGCVPMAALAQQRPARNVILFLADAGGIPTINAASAHGYGAPRRLYVQGLPQIALAETSTASELVTDSAAGMTAIVTGTRTHNGVVGQGPDAVRNKRDGVPLKTILEFAEERGLATGIITNDALTGATPAALYAKSNERGKTADIFSQLLAPRFGDGIDIAIGAGRSDVTKALSATGRNPDTMARGRGRPLLRSLADVPSDATQALVLLDDEELDLDQAIAIALRALTANPRGYFLMVESDTHTDRVRHGLNRMVAFDRTIARTAGLVGDDTLIVFTADHSFDLRIHSGNWSQPLLRGAPADDGDVEGVRLPSVRMDDSHTGEEVLVAARGPGSDSVRGYMANTDIFEVMMSAFGWRSRPSD